MEKGKKKMEKSILIRFSEIFLKGKNRGYFERFLFQNIKLALSSFELEVCKIPGRYEVKNYREEDEANIIERLKKIPGVFSFSPAIKIETDFQKISEIAVSMMSDLSGTFKVDTNRADKHTLSLNSMQISAELGGRILAANSRLRVEIKNPEHILHIDIIENKET